jgi:ABC-2 type transport system permease protein
MEVIAPMSKEISNADRYTAEGLAEKLRKRVKNGEDGSHNLKTVLAIAGKQITILRQYKFDIVYWIFMPLLWLVPFIWLGQSLLGNEESEVFRTYTGSGDYLGFLLIGSMLWATLDSALWGVGNTLRWEQQSGTLEYLWVSPVARTDLLTGQALGEAGWVLINVLGQFTILSVIFGWNITTINVVLSFLAFLIMFIGMLGFGFLFASLIMIFKEPGVLTELTDMVLFIISPVRYPIQGLPLVIRAIAFVLPFTWGATIIRDLFITQKSWLLVLHSFTWLILIDAILWYLGYYVFKKVELRTRKTGNLGSY